MLVKVIGSTRPATFELGMAAVHVPRAPPTKVCAAVLERFVGRSSVKRMSVSAIALGLVTVKVMTEVPPEAMEVGANALVTVGGPYTTRLPVAAAPRFTDVCVVETVLEVFAWP